MPGETAWAVKKYTCSPTGTSGCGWTTRGWRPISVKIQPDALATNGAPTASSEPWTPIRDVGTRPLRVAHSASAATAADTPAHADHQPEVPVGDGEQRRVVDGLAGLVAERRVVRV